jgi:hypothetical protein
MKKNMVFSGLIGLLLVLGLFFSGCDTGSGGGGNSQTYTSTDSSGNKYTLTITENPNRYTVVVGDNYVLVINFADGSGTKRSTGTVDSGSTGTIFKLKPAASSSTGVITINVNGMTMTGILVPATIKYEDGSSKEISEPSLPGSSTGGGSDLLDNNGNLSPQKLVGTVWRMNAEDGSITMTFTGTSTLRVEITRAPTVTGTYTVSGKTINFAIDGENVTGTITGNTLTATLDNVTYICPRVK